MSGRDNRITSPCRRILATEWGYLGAVSLGVFLTLLPHAIGSPGLIERPTLPEHGAEKACFRVSEGPQENRCTTPEEKPFGFSPASALSRPQPDPRRPDDSMDLFFRSLRDTFRGA